MNFTLLFREAKSITTYDANKYSSRYSSREPLANLR